MEFRRLGSSGLQVPALSLGTANFGELGLPSDWGPVDAVAGARMIDICLEHGVSMFDCADVYNEGRAEQVLGEAIKGKRNRLLISTKGTFPTGTGPNDFGSSRQHLVETVETSLRRLRTDHIDLFQLHGQDSKTPVEETVATLDHLVRAGKIRYVGASNFSGWHMMKSLAAADRLGFPRHVAHQVYYSLLNRDYEWELMPLGIDQGVGAVIWSPLGWGKLTGKYRRGHPPKPGTRAHDDPNTGPHFEQERLFRIIEALELVSEDTGKPVPQIALNWLLRRPTVASVIIGARNEEQLLANIGAVDWSLTPPQVKALEDASEVLPPYPVWHQRAYPVEP